MECADSNANFVPPGDGGRSPTKDVVGLCQWLEAERIARQLRPHSVAPFGAEAVKSLSASLGSDARWCGNHSVESAQLLVNRDQSDTQRIEGELDTVSQRELMEDVVHVRLHRTLADSQALGDFAVAQSQRNVAHDLALAIRQLLVERLGELCGEHGL